MTANGSAAAPYSIEALATEFMARFIMPTRKNPGEVHRTLKKDVFGPWRGRDARTIKSRDVLELLDGIVDRGSAVMANRVHSLLKQLFKYGVHRQLIETSPVQLLYAPGGAEKPRSRAPPARRKWQPRVRVRSTAKSYVIGERNAVPNHSAS